MNILNGTVTESVSEKSQDTIKHIMESADGSQPR